MKRTALALTLLLALAPLAPLRAAMPPAVGDTPLPTLAPMIRKVSPAVVNIATRGTIRERGGQNPLLDDPFFRRFFDVPPDTGPRERPFQSAGSGVIFDAKSGYIVTNAHVVENASEITVTLQDGRDLKADVVGSDEPTDVAVLKVKPDRLAQMTLGDSAKAGGRRLRRRHRQSLRPAAHRHLRDRQRPVALAASTRTASRISSRPTPPSIRATPAARWSTCAASWSASTPRSCRAAAATSASASPSRSTWSAASRTSSIKFGSVKRGLLGVSILHRQPRHRPGAGPEPARRARWSRRWSGLTRRQGRHPQR